MFIRFPGPITYQDGLFGASTPDDRYVITTPNADYIPTINQGSLTIQLYGDGRFGMEDPILWPQLYHSRFPHFPFIRRRPRNPTSRYEILWSDLAENEFVPSHGTTVSRMGFVATLRRSQMKLFVDDMNKQVLEYSIAHDRHNERLHFACAAMNRAHARFTYSASFQDLQQQLVTLQRFYLECEAFILWSSRRVPDARQKPLIPSHYIGAYTTQPSVVQTLFETGIPVWLFRRQEEIHGKIVIIHILVHSEDPKDIDVTNPHQAVFEGYPGEATLAATCQGGFAYYDVERVPFTRDYIPKPDSALKPPPMEAPQVPDYAAPAPSASSSSKRGLDGNVHFSHLD